MDNIAHSKKPGKLAYILDAIRNDRHLQRGWLLSVFGILPPETDHHSFEHFGIEVKHGVLTVKVSKSLSPTGLLVIDSEEFHPDEPLFYRDEKIQLKRGDLKCIKQDILTTYGILIINSLLIEYPYSGLVDYINGEITPKLINQTAQRALSGGQVTVEQHIKFENAISAITALSQTAVPSATRRSITINPEIALQKPLLLQQYADRMDDPAAVSELQAKLTELDKLYLKGDPSERFFIKKKTDMARLRTSGMYGSEPDFLDESKIQVMTNSLSEGWDVKDIPMLANTIRGGSFNRGANTALGGNEVKIIARVFQNYSISQNDCMTTRGLDVLINKDNVGNFIGRYPLGSYTPLTAEDCKKALGKILVIRSPAYCTTPGTQICRFCMGDKVSNSGIGINALMMAVTARFLSLFLALVHNTGLSTSRYNYKDRLS